MRYLKLTYFILLHLFLFAKGFAQPTAHALQYDSVIVKTVKPSVVKEQQIFKEVNLDFAKKKENKDTNAGNRFLNWLMESIFGKADHDNRIKMQHIFFWCFIVIGIALAVWLFSKSEFSSFLKGKVKTNEFNFTDVNEDISGIDFNKRIEDAKTKSDYRLAVRWLYLEQLFLLNQKNRIVWEPYKTNMDYLNELFKWKYRADFKAISKIYEYVWYGKYSINKLKFETIELQFKQFQSSINV